VVELVDTLDLGSSAARCGSSSLPARTEKKLLGNKRLFYFKLSLGGQKIRGDEKFILSIAEVSLPARTEKKLLGNKRLFYF
jgi:hypothetical protein